MIYSNGKFLKQFLLLSFIVLTVSSCKVGLGIGISNGPVRIGVGMSDIGGSGMRLSSFHMSIGNYYGVPHRHVHYVVDLGWHDDDVAVLFFLSNHSGVGYRTIIGWRSDGLSWMDITIRLNLSPAIFYYDAGGPPYGKAHGYYGKPRHKWKKMKFKDKDIVNIVNTRFISEHHGYSPKEVMKMRDKGKGFKSVHSSFEKKGRGSYKGGDGHKGGGKGSRGGDYDGDYDGDKGSKGKKGGGKKYDSDNENNDDDKKGKKDKGGKGKGKGKNN